MESKQICYFSYQYVGCCEIVSVKVLNFVLEFLIIIVAMFLLAVFLIILYLLHLMWLYIWLILSSVLIALNLIFKLRFIVLKSIPREEWIVVKWSNDLLVCMQEVIFFLELLIIILSCASYLVTVQKRVVACFASLSYVISNIVHQCYLYVLLSI